MKSKTTIEVNGKQYDATTGAVIGVAAAPVAHSGHNIDGFFRSRHSTPKAKESDVVQVRVAPAAKPEHQAKRSVNHAKAHTPATAHRAQVQQPAEPTEPAQQQAVTHHQHGRVAASHAKRHATQSSRTLMRRSVHRPQPSFHKQAGTVASLQHNVPHLIVPKSSVVGIDVDRMVRAKEVHRSANISHHGKSSLVTPVVAPLAVAPTPGVKPGEGEPPAVPAPKPTNAPVGDPSDPKKDIFEQALMEASHFVDLQAHKLHFKKQARRHVISMASGTLALIVIAGFAVYQNTPGLQFKVASVQAGVSTHMPNFKAAGFAYEGAKARDGKLTVGFSKGGSTYQLTQTTTNLTGDEMIDAVGGTTASGHPAYKTIEAGGTTIYRFDNTNATWVADGTWYTVSGNAALSDNQVESLVKNV